jgi:thioredoxin-related protein
MRSLLILSAIFLSSFVIWQPDFQTAQKLSRQKNQLILLNFSGSDWCGPCIRMRKEIFDNENFSKMADSSLLLVNADFPRNRKNQHSKPIQQQNDELAGKYNPTGKFPYTVLLDTSGKVIRSWEGLPKENAAEFSAIIKGICDAHR